MYCALIESSKKVKNAYNNFRHNIQKIKFMNLKI